MAISPDDTEDLILSCRYGDIDDVKSFIDRFGTDFIGQVRDDHGNTLLHMASANGHTELLNILLPIVPSSLLSAQNNSGSTALHWAALNSQFGTARALVDFPGGPGVDLIDIKNAAGRSPLGEAEAVGWEEGAKWMVEVMKLDNMGSGNVELDDNAPPVREERADVQMEEEEEEKEEIQQHDDADDLVAPLSLALA